MADQKLAIQISADASGAVNGLKVVAQGLDGVGQTAKYRFKESAEAASSLSETLRDFKSEATQASRVANFYARDLAEIVPGAGGAASAIKGLIAAGLSGGGLAAGFEIAIVAIKAINDKIQEQEVEMQRLRAVHIDVSAEIAKGLKQIQRELDGSTTSVQKFKASFADSTTDELKKANKEAAALLDKSGGVVDFIRYMGDVFGAKGPEHATTGISDDIDKTFAPVLQRTKEFDAKKKEIEKTAAEESKKTAREVSDEVERLNAEGGNRIRQIHAQLQVDLHKLDLDGTKNDLEKLGLRVAMEQHAAEEIAKVERQAAAIQEAGDAGRAEILRKLGDQKLNDAAALEQQIGNIRAELQGQMYSKEFARASEEIKKRADEEVAIVRKAQQAHVINFQEMESTIALIRAKAASDTQAELVKENQKWINDFVRPLESSFSNAIKSMITGGKSLGEAMKQIGLDIVNALIDGFVKIGAKAITEALASHVITATKNLAAVTSYAAVAGAAAAASAAATPVIGPFIAIPSGAAVEAAVLASFGPPASAAGGYDIPSGINPLVQTHANEMILPAPLANVIRDLADGGGASGAVHVHVHAPFADGPSLQRFVQSKDFVDAISRAQRLGR